VRGQWGAETHGPAFRPGEIYALLGRATDQIQLDIAKFGYKVVHQYMKSDFRNPTGYYQSRVIVDASQELIALTDQGVIYGSWLEGTSNRNNATRFKGYAMFRRASQAMEAQAQRIAERTLAPYLRRFG